MIKSNNIINFLLLWIFSTSIFLPFLILFFNDDLFIPIEQGEFISSMILEILVLLFAYLCFILLKYFNKIPNCVDFSTERKSDFLGTLVCSISAALIFIHSLGNILSPASYYEVNLIGSEQVFGGGIAFSPLLPLFTSLVVGHSVYLLLQNSIKQRLLLQYYISSLILFAISGVLSGGRMAILYPFIPFFLTSILRNGVIVFIKNNLIKIIIAIPVFGFFIIFLAELRSIGVISHLDYDLNMLVLFFTHLYIKFSGITNSSFLVSSTSPDQYGSVLFAITGALLSFIPRFLLSEKPISGSLTGDEFGLPYRIAANLLGYEEHGNVVLAPATLSYWLGGMPGVVLNSIFFAILFFAISKLISDGIRRGSPLLLGLAIYVIGIPHFIGFYSDFTQSLSIIVRVIFTYLLIVLISSIFKRASIAK